MHSKKDNNSKNNNFIQGLRPFSKSIPGGIKKILRKSGYNFSAIVDNWTKVLGKDISESSYPSKIKLNNEMKDGTLILNVIHGKELEIEYKKKEIADKINSFFGYNCVSQVKLKIVNKEKEMITQSINLKKQNTIFEKKLNTIQSVDLKKSLNSLIKAYNDKKN